MEVSHEIEDVPDTLYVEAQINVLKMLLASYSVSEEVESDGHELWQWFENISQKKPKDTSWKIVSRGVRWVLPQLFAALQDCCLNQRWKQACEILTRISSEPVGTANVIQHVGLELLRLNKTPETCNLSDQLIQRVKLLSQHEINRKITLLQQYFCLMESGKFAEARECLVNIPVSRGPRPRNTSPRGLQINRYLHKAYEGVAYYAMWLSIKNHRPESTDVDELITDYNPDFAGVEMRSYAERAAGCFECVQYESGVFDTFVSYHVEVLEFLQKTEEAKELLKGYSKKNPRNPNGWRLLIAFYKRNGMRRSVKKILVRLCDLVPSDVDAVLELNDILMSEPDALSQRLDILINCLDFEANKHSDCLWFKLVNDLVTNFAVCGEIFTGLWEERKDWWADYHFDVDDLSDMISELNAPIQCNEKGFHLVTLVVSKAAFVCITCGKNNRYLKVVKNYIIGSDAIVYHKLPSYQLFLKAQSLPLPLCRV